MNTVMRLLTSVLMAVLCWPNLAFPSVPDKPNLVGILEVRPSDNSPGPTALEPPIVFREAPTVAALIVGETNDINAIETFEWNYESTGIAVFDYKHDGKVAWYRIYLREKRAYAWIMGRDGLGFRGLSQLVTNSLSYLTKYWDRVVYRDPSSDETRTVLTAPENDVPIEIASTARIDGQLWLLVVVLKESPCISATAPAVLGAGWVPALSETRLLNVWFYSRGC